jgi:hypothetical protein
MKRRNRKEELLKLAQSTKTYIDSLNLKDSDLVITAIAAGVLGKHEVTLRAWRSDGRGPPYSQERDGAAVLYRVGDLWNWCKRNVVDPAMGSIPSAGQTRRNAVAISATGVQATSSRTNYRTRTTARGSA